MSNIELKELKCECGANIWTQAVAFGHVPAVLSESGKAGLAPINSTFICIKCGKSIDQTEEYKAMEADAKQSVITKP
jgi:hypothetical protein